MTKHAAFDLWRKMPRGITGWCASRASLKRKKIATRIPNTTRQMTFGESQGKVAPPKFSPSSTMTIKPMREMLPAQSTAFIPSTNLVFGSWTSKKRSKRPNATPQTGRLTQNIHLQDKYCVKAPPRTGPIPPATAQVTWRSPRKSGRVLPEMSIKQWTRSNRKTDK